MDMKSMYLCYDCDYINLKPYKGYEIQKHFFIDSKGKRKGKPFYLVAECGDNDYCGDSYASLDDAKRFIDSITNGGK